MPRSSRLVLCCIACLLCISLLFKGRVTPGKGEGAAFLRPAPGMIKVRLAGDLPRPGLYLFPDGTPVGTAIKLTAPAKGFANLTCAGAGRPLRSGDIVTVTASGGERAVISQTRMGVKERMLLKIPLDPDQLTREEWSLLPGIGEVLAERIAADRQKSGAFGTVEGLLRVPGIGQAKLAALKPFF